MTNPSGRWLIVLAVALAIGLVGLTDSPRSQSVISVSLNPATITGGSGAAATGTITLSAPAPAGGATVTLTSSNPELAASVQSLTVPAGATSASFTIGTNANYRRYSGLGFSVSITAARGASSQSATLSITSQPQPGPLSSFDAQNEGPMCFGVGVRRTATGYELEFGSAGNLFDCVPPDNPVGQDGTCTFRQECAFGCETRPPTNGSQFNDVCAAAGPYPVAVSQKLVIGGNPLTAALQLNAPAPANSSGLLSSNTLFANTIPNINTPIPQGATTALAEVLTARVNTPKFAPIDGGYNTPSANGNRRGRIGLTWVALLPGVPPPFVLRSLDFDRAPSVTGGTVLFGFTQLNQVAPAPEIGTTTVTVTSSDPSAASLAQPEFTVTQGSSSVGFAIQTHAVSTDRVVTISATIDGSTLTRELTVRATPAATRAQSFFLDPFDVEGGNPASGLVVLDGAAPAGGAAVTLTSGNTSVATMPATVTVPAGSDRVSFTISTSPVSTNTTVSLTARYGNGFAATSLIVTAPPSPATLTSLAVNPTSVTGGNSATGTVTLSAAAPGGGAVVSLSRNNAAATVPASVTVPAGAQSATFTITTTTVTSSTSVIVTATYAGVSRTASLTVTPSSSTTPAAPALVSPSNGATVTLPVTLSWNAASGAASYQVQVDDGSSFSTPRVVDQTVTTTQLTVQTLAARQHWWRVRGRNSSGTAGPWSSVRSFTPQSSPPPPPPPPGSNVTLTVTATGRSGERVTSSPTGINVSVGSTGSASFAGGTQITLSVSNGRDAIWSGACSSGGNKRRTCVFTLNANASVTANVQ
jgi:hypothetical protein